MAARTASLKSSAALARARLHAALYHTRQQRLTRLLSNNTVAPSVGDLFVGGFQGAWYDPADLAALFQDATGTVPVTADGQPVGLMLDKSGNGNHATNADVETCPRYRTDGTRHWLQFRGLDFLKFSNAAYGTTMPLTMMGAMALTANGNYPSLFCGDSASQGVFFGVGDAYNHFNVRKMRLNIGGGPGGAGPLLVHATPFTLNQAYVVAHVLGNPTPEHSGWINGLKVMSGNRSGGGGWALPTEGRIGWTVPTVNSPLLFFGGIIVRSALTAGQMDTAGLWLAERSGTTYATFGTASAVAASQAYAVGDSTVAAYSGWPSVLSRTGSARSPVNVAVPGHAIAQQLSAWNALTVDPGRVGWVVVQIGLNDMDPVSGTTAGVIAALQNLVNAVRAKIGAAPLFVAKMLPARKRFINIFGATNGPLAYQRWLDVNAAVASTITGVDGRITMHEPLLNDGAGNLAAAYDTGDGIHPNTAGRQIMADAWVAALTAAGVTV